MDTSFYSDLETVGLAVHLVLKANHKDKKIIFNGEEITVKRGQMITGRKTLAKETNCPESTLWDKLKILKNVGFLDINSNNRFSVITIVKYSQYQDRHKKPDSVSDSQPTASQQPADTNNNDKNEKNDKKKETSPIGSSVSVPTEKKKTIVDLYCIGYELTFKVKPYLTESGSINIPKSEVMALQRIKTRFGEDKARAFFIPDESGRATVFTDPKFTSDSWIAEKNFSPNSLEKKLIDIKNKSLREGAHAN